MRILSVKTLCAGSVSGDLPLRVKAATEFSKRATTTAGVYLG